MAEKNVDILIMGGGLVGAALLLALQNTGYTALLVESQPFSDKIQPDFDARTLALSPASVHIFQALNLWETLKTHATPVQTIHVSEAGHFGAARLAGSAENPLGYILEMQHINQAFARALPADQVIASARIRHFNKQKITLELADKKTLDIKAALIVAADGADSKMREFCQLPVQIKQYDQAAIVTNIGLQNPHGQQAFERFTLGGPLALLPMSQQRAALVWTLKKSEAEKYMQVSDADFLKALQTIFGYRLGRFHQVGKRSIWPLKQVWMPTQTEGLVVFIGNAAHTLHPVAAQGFNLGLRDVATLTQCIQEQGINEAMLASYQTLRKHDQRMITCSTDILAELFTLNIPGFNLLRNMGLIAVDNIPFLKKTFSRYARGFGGYIADLVCSDSPGGSVS